MNILDKIIETKKEEVKKLRKEFSFSRFKDSYFYEQSKISLEGSLSKKEEVSIIAEVKKASPSKGVICNNFDHLKIADQYMNNGIAAMSVLTDTNYFQGDIAYLNDIAKIKSVPLLRKDFIIDEFQVYEAKSNGADAILLISEALSENQIAELTYAAFENDLEVLLELHNENQITKINFDLNRIIGVNNRDLATFKTDIGTTEKIYEKINCDIILVSESGIKNKADIDYLKTFNTNAVLVGEHFMRSSSISDSVKYFKEWCQYES